MSDSPLLKITKLEAARGQLRSAIELWFSESDAASIHTLACASHEIIHDICRQRGISDLIYDSTVIKDEYRGYVVPLLKRNANFFKHARNDSDKTIEFDPKLSSLFMFVSIVGLQRIGEPVGDVEDAFIYWNKLHNDTWFSQIAGNDAVPVDMINKLRGIPKQDFLKVFLGAKRNRVE